MTYPSPYQPPPFPYESMIPAEKQYSWIGGIIAWCVIIVAVGFIALAVMTPGLKGKKPAVVSDMDSMNTDLTIRLTLGEFYAFKSWGMLQQGTEATLVGQVKSAVSATTDRLKVVAVIGEIQGKDAAIKELDSIAASTTQATSSTQPTALQGHALRKIYTGGVTALTNDERASVEKLGFAGDVALSFQESARATDSQIAQDAKRRFTGLLTWLVVMMALSAIGLILLIIGIILLGTGSLRFVGLPLHVPGIPFVEAFALYMALFFAASIGLSMLHLGSVAWQFPLILLLPVAFVYVHWRGESWQNVFNAFGWHRGRGVIREIFAGVIGYIAGLPVLILGFTLAIILMKATGSKPSHPITTMVSEIPWWMLYLLASVWAPIFEETMFRGALLHHLRRVMPWIGAAPIVSLIFAMIHPQGLAFIPALGAIAMVLAALREWRGSIIAPMVAHGLSNAATITLLLIMVK